MEPFYDKLSSARDSPRLKAETKKQSTLHLQFAEKQAEIDGLLIKSQLQTALIGADTHDRQVKEAEAGRGVRGHSAMTRNFYHDSIGFKTGRLNFDLDAICPVNLSPSNNRFPKTTNQLKSLRRQLQSQSQ